MTSHHRPRRLGAALLLAGTALTAPVLAHAETTASAEAATVGSTVGEVVVTARHRTENVQNVPVAVSVIGSDFLNKTNTTSVASLSQYVPSLQFTFFNARNANINIRGLGNNVGLANDGIEPGVGFYVDGVYYDRPATATFDLIDLDQVEILRGPQGTLFGKNTTAGALNLTTAGPTSSFHALGEISGGNLGYFQAKASISGPIFGDVLEGRLSVASTSRGGLLKNLYGNNWVNAYRNRTIRAQLAYTPTNNFKVRLIGDYSKQDTNCCDQVIAGVVSPPNGKNFLALTQMFGYTPIIDPGARVVDTNSTIQARQETGGLSAQADWSLPAFTLTSVTAWRFWNWWPANDSDYTPLSVLTRAQNGDHQNQISQEFRIASNGEKKFSWVGGLYFFHEQMGAIGEQQFGNAATAFLLKSTLPSFIADGYTLNFWADYHTTSLAAFGQTVWHVTDKLSVTTGLRYTYDRKNGWFNQVVSGGIPLTGALAAFQPLRNALGVPTYFTVAVDKGDLSGMGDISYQWTPDVMTYATYSRGTKSEGLNMAQLPPGASSIIQPETLDHFEVGAKTRWLDRRVTINADLFWEEDANYQANVYDPTLGKQYLSNVPKVRSRGIEVDVNAQPSKYVNFYVSSAYDDAIYETYPTAPCGLENITKPFCNLTNTPLAGVPRYTVSAGGEYHHAVTQGAEAYLGLDYTYRSSEYSAATDSIYSRLGGLDLLNARLGLREPSGRWDAYVWAKNISNRTYFTYIAAGVGNTGALTGQLGDPRAFGATLRVTY